MNLPTIAEDKTRVLSAFAALRGNPHFEALVEQMRTDLAALDTQLRAAPISAELGKTQGGATYAAEFLRLADTAHETLRGMTRR